MEKSRVAFPHCWCVQVSQACGLLSPAGPQAQDPPGNTPVVSHGGSLSDHHGGEEEKSNMSRGKKPGEC